MSSPNLPKSTLGTIVSKRKLSPRRWIVAIVLVVTTCAVIFAVSSAHSKARHYRKHMDAESLFAVLREEVRPGDSIQRVEALLGKGQVSRKHKWLVASVRAAAQRFPQTYQSGVETDDEFLGYCYGNTEAIFLQFRERRLINFDPIALKQTSEFPLAVR